MSDSTGLPLKARTVTAMPATSAIMTAAPNSGTTYVPITSILESPDQKVDCYHS